MPGILVGYGGYMDFDPWEFYRNNYGLTEGWVAATVIALLVPLCALVTALLWWQKCKPLWEAREQGAVALQRRRITSPWTGQ